jgi:hypothetical protein
MGVENFSSRYDNANKSECYDRFANMCEAMFSTLDPGDTPQLPELLMLEAFLRCGKHMPLEAKTANRARADKLIEEILKP